MDVENHIGRILETQGIVILDGGLSTVLEAAGHDVSHPLWTARLIDSDSAAIKAAHREYLDAGADCIISSSYQASMQGLTDQGYSEHAAIELIERSYRLAQESCDVFWANSIHMEQRTKPVVAASIGPYGAYLADGSEYRGDYDIGEDQLVDFHRTRLEILSPLADLLAIETIPSIVEGRALRRLLCTVTTAYAWVSFCCRDDKHLADGTPIQEAATLFCDLPQVIAIGVNCTHPNHVAGLIAGIGECCGNKEIVVYPNSGELYSAARQSWSPGASGATISKNAMEWYDLGARLIGGCCGVGSEEIRRLRESMTKHSFVHPKTVSSELAKRPKS